MDNNWYEEYVTTLERDGTFNSIARSAKYAAEELIQTKVDWSGPSYLFAFSGALFGTLTLTTDMIGPAKWLLGISLILLNLAVLFFAIRTNLQNERRLRRELTLLYYTYYLQYQVIKDATYNTFAVDLKHCKSTIDNLHSDIRSNWPAKDIADESNTMEKIFRI